MKHHRKNKKRVLNVRVLWLAILAFWSFSQRTHALEVSISRYYDTVATEYPAPFSATVSEDSILSFWNWGDGDVTTNRLTTHHGYSATGVYSILFIGINATDMQLAFAQTNITVVEASTHYVSPSGSRTPPYTNWETATPIIQEAVDAAETLPGTRILVTNGIYDQGGAHDSSGNDLPLNRVVLDKPLMLKSVNGPDQTVIEGSLYETNLRCVYLGTGACIYGFTIRHANVPNHYGGGIFCEAYNVISNCIISSNRASSGGGVYGGTLYDCLLQTNRAVGYAGGGAYESMLYRCRLIDNTASIAAAAHCSLLYDCYGHGNFCPLTMSGSGPPYANPLTISCSIIFSDPQEPHGCDYRLNSFSPCINRGNNSRVIGAVDLDGNARIQGGIVDMGAFEYAWDAAQIPTDWLSSYGLNTNGSADQADTDGDGFSNRQEWRAGTDPTNSTSFLYLLAANEVGSSVSSNGGFIVRWASRQGISYKLLRCYDLNEPLVVIASNIVGQANQTTYADMTVSNTAFYRVAVE